MVLPSLCLSLSLSDAYRLRERSTASGCVRRASYHLFVPVEFRSKGGATATATSEAMMTRGAAKEGKRAVATRK